jgi:16S rRNA (guanine527-N7)-methyltransferase
MDPAQIDPAERLASLAERYGLSPAATARLGTLLARLAADERAPTSISGATDALDRHIADSLAGLELSAVRDAAVAADLGSGAGLPGLVLAAALPGLGMRLVEAQRSKCAYIATLVAAMELGNTRVVCRRAESWEEGLGSHDLVVARALGAQPLVLEYAAPLLGLGGTLVEWRGARDRDEEARAARAASELGLRPVEVRAVVPFRGARSRHLHLFEKVAATPARFPRREGVAARRPLGG